MLSEGDIDGTELGMTDWTLVGFMLGNADGMFDKVGSKVPLILGLLEVVGIVDLTIVGSVLGLTDASLVGTFEGLKVGTALVL